MSASYQISHQLYKWLVNYDVLPNNLKYKPSGNFHLQQKIVQQLQSGFLLTKLVTKLAYQLSINVNLPLLSSIKNSNTPAARVYNWNILTDSFQKLDITLAKEEQKQITSGNFNSLIKFLIQINLKGKSKNIKTEKHTDAQQFIDLRNIHKYENIKQSESVLQMIILLISNAFSLTPKQSIATLSQSSKYLSHLIVKGMKGSFDQVLQFIHDSEQKLGHMMYLAQKGSPSKNIEIILQIYKPTLISRDVEVARKGCSLLEQINYESLKYNGKNIIYQILCKQAEGFDFIYMGLKRHPHLNYQIFDFMFPLIEHAFKDFFMIQLQRTINNEQQYVLTLLLIFQPMMQNPTAKDNLWKGGVINHWQAKFQNLMISKSKGKQNFNSNEQTKILYIELMYEILISFYEEYENQEFQNQLVSLVEGLKKNARSQIESIRIPSLYKLFNLLEFLAFQKNKLAALLYKKLIFLFVQNHEDSDFREIMATNFVLVLKKFPTIPLEFLIEPLLKQLSSTQGVTYILNMYDFELMLQLCKHPKMNQEYSLSFLEYFLKLYVKSIIYSPIILQLINVIIDRFGESEMIRDQCLSFTQKNLSIYSMLSLGKNNSYAKKRAQKISKQNKIINNQKKSLIIQIIKKFIHIQHSDLTSRIQQKVLKIYVDWYENKGIQDKGLESILRQIGDLDDLLVQYTTKREQDSQNKEHLTQKNSQQANYDSRIISVQGSPGLGGYYKQRNNNLHTQDNEQGKKNLKDLGIGYKKKKSSLNKYEVLLSNKSVKPDPRVLEDIEKIKQKWKLEHSRSKINEQEAKKQKFSKANQKELFQRNLSLGYAKLPNNLNPQKILFQFNTVKKSHLKRQQYIPIVLDLQEDREQNSVHNILQKYKKHINILFKTHSKRSGYATANKQTHIDVLSFTEIMKMLRDKGLLGRTPKIVINQIISNINQKRRKEQNVLGGIYIQDFPYFLIYLTDIFLRSNLETLNENVKDQPFGIKLQKLLLKMFQNELSINQKELFDPKIQKIKQQIQYDNKIKIPEGYKKVSEIQIELNRDIKKYKDFSIKPKYANCYQILDGIIYEALGITIITPYTQFVQKSTIVAKPKITKPLEPNSTQKYLKISERIQTEQQNSRKQDLSNDQVKIATPFKKRSGYHKNINDKSKSHRNVGSVGLGQELDEQSQKKWVQKEKKRQEHAKKLKDQLQKLKQEKQKIKNEEREKQKMEQQKKRKKEEMRKLYLQQNKKKIQDSKSKHQEQQRLKEQKQKQLKLKKKAELKEKGAVLLEKQRKVIQQKLQKVNEKKKNQQLNKNKKEAILLGKNTSGNTANVQKILQEKKKQAQQQKMRDLMIKNSLDSGELKNITDKHNKHFKQLFQAYWIWDKQKMDLKSFAQILKDFDISQIYVTPHLIADTYKNVAKGSLLNLKSFIQCLAKLAYKSQQINKRLKVQKQQKEAVSNEQNAQKSDKKNEEVDGQKWEFMINLLKMKEKNYKQIILKQKGVQ